MSSNINSIRPVIVEFLNFSGVAWTKNSRCAFRVKPPFSNSVVWTAPYLHAIDGSSRAFNTHISVKSTLAYKHSHVFNVLPNRHKLLGRQRCLRLLRYKSRNRFITWPAPWGCKMSWILRCDWLPKRAKWGNIACLELPAVSRKKTVFSFHKVDPLFTKLIRSRWMDITMQTDSIRVTDRINKYYGGNVLRVFTKTKHNPGITKKVTEAKSKFSRFAS